MKLTTLIMTIILFVALAANQVYAGDVQVSMKHLSDTTGNDYFVMQRWMGVEIKYQPEKDSLYYFVSHDKAGLVTTYPAFDMSFTGIGFGFNTKVSKKVRLYGQLGYYIVDTSLKGRFKCPQFSCGEGLYYGLNDQWADLHTNGLVSFNEYEVQTENGYGITFGVEMTHNLTKNTELLFGIEYRALSVKTMIAGMSPVFGDYDTGGQRWESHFKGIDSTNFKLGINYEF